MEQQTITIVKVKNPFDRYDREFEIVPYAGLSLSQIKDLSFPFGEEIVTSVNGQIVPVEHLPTAYLSKGDCVTFVPVMEGGDTLRTLAFIALAVAIMVAAPYAGFALQGAMIGMGFGEAAVLAGYYVGAAVFSMAAMAVGGMLINAVLPPPSIEPADAGSVGSFDQSQTYSWSPKSIQQQGTVIPKCYGIFKLFGNVLSSYSETKNDKDNYINVLLGICQGPISRMYDFYINKQPIYNYTGIETYARYGLISQTVIPNFNDTKTEYNMSRKIAYGSPVVYTTVGNSFNGLEVDVICPKGLYHQNDQGGLSSHSLTITIEYRKSGVGTYTAIAFGAGFVNQTSPTGYWSRGWHTFDYVNVGWKEVEAGSPIAKDHYEGEPGVPDGCWHWIEGSVPYTFASNEISYLTMTGNVTSSIKRTLTISNLTQGAYDIRVSKITADVTDIKYGDDVYLSTVREVVYEDFQYPSVALVGARALASNQLSGSFEFSCMVEGALIRVYRADEVLGSDDKNYRCILDHVLSIDTMPITGVNWATYWEQKGHSALLGYGKSIGNDCSATPSFRVEFSNNPAWVCYDALTQPIILDDLSIEDYEGINPSRIVEATFVTWADYCDTLVPDGVGGTERRITFNGVFDSQSTLWDAIGQVCKMSRALPVFSGFDISVVVDQQATPCYLFSSGNVMVDSFKETFMTLQDRAGEVEIQYTNSENDYERDTVSYFDPELDRPDNKVSIQAIGISHANMAWRLAKYYTACNYFQRRTITFDVDVEAIRCTVGDVVNFAHSVPRWGIYDGRIVSATANTVTLDQDIELIAGKQYSIILRLFDDTVVSKTVVNPPGVWNQLYISGVFTTIPVQYDVYVVGELGLETKPFRIIGLSRTGENIITVSAIEYNDSMYVVDYCDPPLLKKNYSILTPMPNITNLSAKERMQKWLDGTIETSIDISFTVPNSYFWDHAEIWSDVGAGWKYEGRSLDGTYILRNALEGSDYLIAAIGVSKLGVKKTIAQSPQTSLHIFGKTSPPENITEIWCEPSAGGLKLTWTPVSDIDIYYYRVKWSSDLVNGSWAHSFDVATSLTNTVTIPAARDGIYFVKAVDTTAHESLVAISVETTIPSVLSWHTYQEDEESPLWLGEKIECIVRDTTLIPNSRAKWDEIADFDVSLDIDLGGDVYSGGTYTTGVFDFLAIQSVRLSFTTVFNNVCMAATFDEIVDLDSTVPFDTEDNESAWVTPQLCLSQDGITFGTWRNFIAGDYTCRAAKFRLLLQTSDTRNYSAISSWKIYFDFPGRSESGADIVCPTTGLDITYNAPFMVMPKIGVTVQNSQPGDRFIVYGKKLDGFRMMVMDNSAVSNFTTLSQGNKNTYGVGSDIFGDVHLGVYSGQIYKQSNSQGNFISIGQPPRLWRQFAPHPNGSLFAAVYSGQIYRKPPGSSNFSGQGQTDRSYIGIAINSKGDLYASVDSGDIYRQRSGQASFEAMGQGSKAWREMCCAPNDDIYVCVYNGDIYKMMSGQVNFTGQAQTVRNYYGMAASPAGDIYCSVYGGNIYKQTAGAGTFNSLSQTIRNWSGMAIVPNGDIYCCEYGGDIYRSTLGVGVQRIVDWTAVGH